MVEHSASRGNNLHEFEILPVQSVALEQEDFERAFEVSDRVVTEPRQWQTYLNALALFGFQKWLDEWAADLVLDWTCCSIFQPQYANVIEAAFNLEITDFKLCLIATGGAIDLSIKLPRAVVDVPEFRSHFYILIRVLEEQAQIQVIGFLGYDQWVRNQQFNSLDAEQDWNYRVPTQWFTPDLNRLLLHLSCLDIRGIPPVNETVPQPEELSQAKRNLLHQFSRLGSVETPLWQLLSWEEGKRILTNPLLLDWLYQLQTGQIPLQEKIDNSQSLLQPILNARQWLQNELDEAAQALGWLLLPQFSVLRSPQPNPASLPPATQLAVKEIDFIRKRLSRDNITIPNDAGCIYKDLRVDDLPLRIYAVSWLLRHAGNHPDEWTLLLILKRQSEYGFNRSVRLLVKDQTNLLAEQVMVPGAKDNYLYTRVIGAWNEAFFVTIALEAGATLTLPPFTFHLDE